MSRISFGPLFILFLFGHVWAFTPRPLHVWSMCTRRSRRLPRKKAKALTVTASLSLEIPMSLTRASAKGDMMRLAKHWKYDSQTVRRVRDLLCLFGVRPAPGNPSFGTRQSPQLVVVVVGVFHWWCQGWQKLQHPIRHAEWLIFKGSSEGS